MQGLQDIVLRWVGLLHQHRFGNFHFQVLGCQAGGGEGFLNIGQNIALAQLKGREIDGHGHFGQTGIVPGFELAAGLKQNPAANAGDQATLFCKRNELQRPQDAALRVLPAHQGLKASQSPCF